MSSPISSNKTFRLSWNVLLVVVILYSIVVIPFILGFGLREGDTLILIGLGINFIFFIDIILNFITPYYHKGKIVRDKVSIAKHYIKSWFFIDVLITVPFDTIIILLYPETTSWASALALLRLLRVVRIYRFLHELVWNASFNPSLMRIIGLGFSILFATHIISCTWFFLGIHSNGECGYASWIERNNLVDQPVFIQYVRSLYWAVTTMATVGYGDITPLTPSETIFAIVIMLIGASVFAYIIANMASLIANLDATAALFQKKMQSVNNYARAHHLPKHLNERIRQYFTDMRDMGSDFVDDNPLDALPRSIKLDVALYINARVIQEVPMFKDADSGLINALVLMLKTVMYLPGDIIIQQGNIGREMYFLTLGKVDVWDDNTNTLCATLDTGSFFGEIALLQKNATRTRTVRAQGHVECSVLKKEYFDALLEYFPRFAEKIREIAANRQSPTNPG